MEGPIEGARDLVLALFRLAVCDYLGQKYGHDQPASPRRIKGCCASEAAFFLTSRWASHLAEMAGFQAAQVWNQACRAKQSDGRIDPVPDRDRRAA